MKNKNPLLHKSIPPIGKKLIKYTGKEMINRIGQDVIKNVVTSILCGGNVRALTESLTQRRLLISNASLFMTYLKGTKLFENFDEDFTSIISNELLKNNLTSEDKIFLQWFLGLTGKGIQNVLRSDPEGVKRFLDEFNGGFKKITMDLEKEFGELESNIKINNDNYLLKWPNLLRIFYAIGTQTLALRGSEKSMYGKLFEKLTLGSLLSILDFELIGPDNTNKTNKVFWLSQQKEKRESDATLLYKSGVGARFDIGFIGPGNSEISLDKVSRFEREMEHGRQLHYMSTIILVDRIGEGSRIVEMAKQINGNIVQMSMAFWVKEVALILNEKMKFQHQMVELPNKKSIDYIKNKMKNIDITKFI